MEMAVMVREVEQNCSSAWKLLLCLLMEATCTSIVLVASDACFWGVLHIGGMHIIACLPAALRSSRVLHLLLLSLLFLGALLTTLQRHTGPIFSLKWSKKGDMLLSGSVDKTACVWDAQSGNVKQQFDFHQGRGDLAVGLALRKTGWLD
jgi:WD40 repeat protein